MSITQGQQELRGEYAHGPLARWVDRGGTIPRRTGPLTPDWTVGGQDLIWGLGGRACVKKFVRGLIYLSTGRH